MTTTRAKQDERSMALETLAAVSEQFPELRVCQLIVNATIGDPFYITDEKLTDALMDYLKLHGDAR